MVDSLGNLEHAAAVADPQCLHGGRDSQADGLLGAGEVGDHEACGHGVEATVDALYAGIEALQVYAEVLALALGHGLAPVDDALANASCGV